MASPTLSSPRFGQDLSSFTMPRIQPSLAPSRPSRLPRPVVTSRGFHKAYLQPRAANLPPRAKTARIGFLHLPDEVRTRIYELAIFDHDRGAVFLPRNLPRKVLPGVDDEDIEYVETPDHSPELHHPSAWQPRNGIYDIPPLPVKSIQLDNTAAAGYWIGAENLPTATFRTLQLPAESIEFMTDQAILDELDNMSLAESSHDEDSDILGSESDVDHIGDIPCDIQTTISSSSSNLGRVSSPLDLDLYFREQHRQEDSDRVESDVENCQDSDQENEVKDEDTSDGCASEDGCDDPSCRFCCCHPKYFDDAVKQKQGLNVFEQEENGDMDDPEHFDTEEQIGMLYEPREPAILSACKEIRKQCLPIYFSHNAFSWRFTWTDYHRSCKRFRGWVNSISADHLKLVTKITFQGRHAVEEGVEFSLNVDLLDSYPFFETSVYEDYQYNSPDNVSFDSEIVASLHREAANFLWMIVQHERSRPRLTAAQLLELGNVFVQGMHRDGSGAMAEEASLYRYMLHPFFC